MKPYVPLYQISAYSRKIYIACGHVYLQNTAKDMGYVKKIFQEKFKAVLLNILCLLWQSFFWVSLLCQESSSCDS